MPTPTPPKVSFSHMPIIGIRPVNGLRLSCIAPTEPLLVDVVSTAQVGPEAAPKRSSLPSRLPTFCSIGSSAKACGRRLLEIDRAGDLREHQARA